MKKFLAILTLIALCLTAKSDNLITATVTVTNTAGVTNGQTIAINATTFTWTNSVILPAVHILTNSSIGGVATNLFNELANFPPSGLTLAHSGTNGITLRTAPGGALTVTLSVGWGTVVLTTNTTAAAVVNRIPYTVESAAQQTNIVSGVVAEVNADQNTNAISPTAYALSNYVAKTTAQTISGDKTFSSVAGIWNGIVSNSPAISGLAYGITNGTFWTNAFKNPSFTNGVNYLNAFSSPGSGSSSEQFGLGAISSAGSSLAVGHGANASGASSTAVGASSTAANDSALALGRGTIASGPQSMAIGYGATALFTGSMAIGNSADSEFNYSLALGTSSTTTADHQFMFGTSAEYAHFPGSVRIDGNTDLTWKRFPVTSLANGNNAAIVVGTNTFIEVSGPSGAFTINGIAGGRDGKFLIILNQTVQNMTIAHDSGTDPTAANRIYSLTSADQTTTGNGAAMFIYSGAASRWIMISFAP